MRLETEYWRQAVHAGTSVKERFTESHALEARTDFHDGGLRRLDALELVNKWNRQGGPYRYFLIT